MSRPRSTNNFLLFCVATAIAALLTYLLWHFSPNLNYLLSERMGAHPDPDTIINVLKINLDWSRGLSFCPRTQLSNIRTDVWLRTALRPQHCSQCIYDHRLYDFFLNRLQFIFSRRQSRRTVHDLGNLWCYFGLALQDTLGNFFFRNLTTSRSAISSR